MTLHRLIATARLASAPKPVQHGSASGVYCHGRAKETPCRIWNRVMNRCRDAARSKKITDTERDSLMATVEAVTVRIATDHPEATLDEVEQLYDEAMSESATT